MKPVREKVHRLPEAAYIGRKSVSFVACEEKRRPLLAAPEVVNGLVPLLADAAWQEGCIVPIYCFMPDHIHVMVYGLNEKSRPKAAMERFKHSLGRWAKYDSSLPIQFQKDFYDRIVRRSEGFAATVRYIALNPVRAKLASDIHTWPLTGAIDCDLKEVLLDSFWS